MLIEESNTIKKLLISVSNQTILNACSSDEYFYKTIQPYIYYNVIEPLIRRGNTVHNLDQSQMAGIDIVANVTDMGNISDETYDIVLFFNGLEHIAKPKRAIKEIFRVLKKCGVLLASCPAEYVYHPDPIDTMLRLKTSEDWQKLLKPWFNISYFSKVEGGEYGYPTIVVCERQNESTLDKTDRTIDVFRYTLTDKDLSRATTGISRIYDFNLFYKTLSYSTHSVNRYFPNALIYLFVDDEKSLLAQLKRYDIKYDLVLEKSLYIKEFEERTTMPCFAFFEKWSPTKHDLDEGEVYLDYDIVFLKKPEELIEKAKNHSFVFAEAIQQDANDVIYERIRDEWGENRINVNAGFLFQARERSIECRLHALIKEYHDLYRTDKYAHIEQSILNVIANETYHSADAELISASLHPLTDEVEKRIEELEYIHLTGICRRYKRSVSFLKEIEKKKLVEKTSRFRRALNAKRL
jgi:SAM-dependent methyltransferase